MILPGQERRAIVTTAASSTARDSLKNLLRNHRAINVCKSNRLNRHTFSIKGASGEAVQTRLLEHPESQKRKQAWGNM